jgi:hypothetical protein
MSRWRRWQQHFEKKVKELENDPFTSDDDREQFFECELGLRLRDHICPDAPYSEIWPLLSAYRLSGINERDDLFAMCMKARQRIRFLRTEKAWEKEAERYMEDTLSPYRLYAIDLKTKTVTRTQNGLWPERIDIYDKLLFESAAHTKRHTKLAQAGSTYTFIVDDAERRVTIPEAFMHKTSPPPIQISHMREPLDISFDDLLTCAAEMDAKLPRGNWKSRMSDLQQRLAQNVGGQLVPSTKSIRLDGIYNLIGIGSSGKSTLLWVLAYYLTTRLGHRVGMVVTTLVDSVSMAEDFARLGVKAAPISGHDRAGHRLKFGQTHKDDLLPEDVFRPDVEDHPSLQWMSGPCAIAGLTDPIPLGQEPCMSLKRREGIRETLYSCPLLFSCPLHQAKQDMAEAFVWIATPASFLYTRAPEQVTRDDMHTLELMYRECDEVFFDEADEKQTWLDAEFAPTNDLRGASDEAILSRIDSDLSDAFLRYYTRTARNPSNKDQKKYVEESRHFADLALELRGLHTEVASLLKERPLALLSLLHLLATQLWKDATDQPHADKAELLYKELEAFAITHEGDLAAVANDANYRKAGDLTDKLFLWLSSSKRNAPLDLTGHPQKHMLLLKLEFALCLVAMDIRFHSLIQERLYAGIGDRLLDQIPPPEYQDLVPSAIGTLLGYQLADRKAGPVLQYLQSRGIGRWILLHYPELFLATDGQRGPHTVYASATGVAPGSPQFHIHRKVNAVLSPPDDELQAIGASTFQFIPVPDKIGNPIRVSGTHGEDGQDPYRNLEKLVRHLAEPGPPNGKSILEHEIDFWQGQGRLPALITNSYPQAQHVQKILQTIPFWHNKTIVMRPDAEGDSRHAWEIDTNDSTIRRGEIERLREKGKSLPIFPLLAFQRAYNILDTGGKALLGSAYFLVRPFPHPDDATLPIIGANAAAIKELVNWTIPASYGTRATEMLGKMREQARWEWIRRMPSSQVVPGLRGMMAGGLYKEYLWDQLVVIWQACLRFFRGGQAAHVYFVDGAFHPKEKEYPSTLRGWIAILDEYLDPTSSKDAFDRQLVEALYGPAYKALKKLEKELPY